MIDIAFGTWKVEVAQALDVVNNAISSGYRHIDTAAAYANENAIGEGIMQTGVPRNELFVSGKLWTTKRAYDATIKSCKRSLKNLRMEYFDQYLIHWPASPALFSNWQEINAETWLAMETLKQEGLVRSIGVCNFKPRHIDALMQHAKVMPEVDQIEFHPGYWQKETVTYCKENNIKVEAWSPLGNGALLTHPTLCKIAEYHGRSAAQICLHWCIQHGVLPITKTVSVERMKDNLRVFDFELCDAEMLEIDNMPVCGYSGLDPDTITQFG